MALRRFANKDNLEPLGIGIVGLGTVGAGVFSILSEKPDLIANRAGQAVNIVSVSARDKSKDRGIDTSAAVWSDDPLSMASNPAIDVVVELVGGEDGLALELARATLSAGKAFVTANKALIARHGVELVRLAEKHNAILAFEAAVAGGIPILSAMKNGLSANEISSIAGILNGTCNYILTKMESEARSFDDVLKEAQELGYAEADPTFDVDGIDTAHKLAILTSLAFGCPIDMDAMRIDGIRDVTLEDIRHAAHIGYRIKLLGVTELKDGVVEQRVQPSLVKTNQPIAQVSVVTNAVLVQCDALGPLLLEGAGAGAGPTASAVVADIVDIASGRTFFPLGIPTNAQQPLSFADASDTHGAFYARFEAYDTDGILAGITQALSEEKISVEQVHQPHAGDDGIADIIVTTHACKEQALLRAITKLTQNKTVIAAPIVLRIESFEEVE